MRKLIEAHGEFRSRALNLQASENLLSSAARLALSSDMASRYSLVLDRVFEGVFIHNAYGGAHFMEALEAEARALACRVFKAKHALVEPVGGHIASMIALLSTTPKAGLVASSPQQYGGYTGYDGAFLPQMFSMRAAEYPFDEARWNIDYDALPKFLRETNPETLLLGASYILFPYDLKAVRDACEEAEVSPKLLYDGSHVLGLIAGGEFQKPLDEGVLALFGSTHKSFFGPQGGLFLTNDKRVHDAAFENLTWRTMDNAHENRIAALAVALAETEAFGRDYARRVVELSHALGEQLDARGFPVRFRELGYSRSHQLLIDDLTLKKRFHLEFPALSERLGKSSIVIDSVGRIGTAELARCGAKPDQMEELAKLIVVAAKGSNVRRKVEAFKAGLPAPAFTFD